MAEESLPRSAENIALALGALCAVSFHGNVLPYLQWPSASKYVLICFIVLGFASCCS